jgi:hypothetical protein
MPKKKLLRTKSIGYAHVYVNAGLKLLSYKAWAAYTLVSPYLGSCIITCSQMNHGGIKMIVARFQTV